MKVILATNKNQIWKDLKRTAKKATTKWINEKELTSAHLTPDH